MILWGVLLVSSIQYNWQTTLVNSTGGGIMRTLNRSSDKDPWHRAKSKTPQSQFNQNSRDTVPLTLIGYALGFLVHLLLKTILHHDALS